MLGILDIGTRSTRILFGPNDKNEITNLKRIKNLGEVTSLGLDIDSETKEMPLDCPGLERNIHLILKYVDECKRRGVSRVFAVGTAIFRQLSNQDEVLETIRANTGVTVNVLSKEDEAALSLYSLYINFDKEMTIGDIAILIDQGGGSTELSWMEKTSDSDFLPKGLISLNLGTVVLNRAFIDELPGPTGEPETIYDKYIRAMKIITNEIENSRKLEIDPYSDKVRVFAVGSAITNITPGKSNREKHGFVHSVREMEEKISIAATNYEHHKILISALRDPNTNPWILEDLDRQLMTLYGLPVYNELVKSFDNEYLKTITTLGFALRYGVYYSEVLGKNLGNLVESEIRGL
ncbi:MAG: hypothetical protein COA79_25520 [Planctomycetota bacterium]|nr:MAG: hypothetical protein COA79_25520 [Planctomycetota bacterium]